MHEHAKFEYASSWRNMEKYFDIRLNTVELWLGIGQIGTYAKIMEDMGKHLGVPQSMQFETSVIGSMIGYMDFGVDECFF